MKKKQNIFVELIFVLCFLALVGCVWSRAASEPDPTIDHGYKTYFARTIDSLYSEPDAYYVSNRSYKDDLTEEFKKGADLLYTNGDYEAIWNLCQERGYNIMIKGDTLALAYDFEGEPAPWMREALDNLRVKLSGYGMLDENGNNITEKFVADNIEAYENGDYYELSHAMARYGGHIVGP